MKTLGIVGGIGPESTIDYYRMLIAGYQERVGKNKLPPILITSLDVYYGLSLLDANELDKLTNYVAAGVRQLADAGADFGIIAANSPHLVFDEVQNHSGIPLISIVEAAAAAVTAQGFSRVGLMGTRFTMQAGFYPEVFGRAGIAIVRPTADEIAYIHEKYIGELLEGTFLPDTRAQVLSIVDRMREREHIEAVVLAGTELPLLLRDGQAPDIPLLDTTRIHVEAAIAQMMA